MRNEKKSLQSESAQKSLSGMTSRGLFEFFSLRVKVEPTLLNMNNDIKIFLQFFSNYIKFASSYGDDFFRF